MVQDDKVIHIAHILTYPHSILDVMVELIQIHVGQKLTGQRPQRQAAVAFDAATLRHKHAQHVEHILVANRSSHYPQKNFVVYAVKILSDVSLEDIEILPAVLSRPQYAGQVVAGGVRAFSNATSKTLFYEAPLEVWPDNLHQRVVNDTVREGRCMDQAALGFIDVKLAEGPRTPLLRTQKVPQMQQVFFEPRIEP